MVLKIYLSVQTSCHQSIMMSIRVKKYFESSAWDVLGALITDKEQFPNWQCSTCEEDLHEFDSIQCDSFLNWHHMKCVCLKAAPKQKWWYCSRCYEICGC